MYRPPGWETYRSEAIKKILLDAPSKYLEIDYVEAGADAIIDALVSDKKSFKVIAHGGTWVFIEDENEDE